MEQSPGPRITVAGRTWHPWVVPIALVALAAVLRFVALPTRGEWDADQGEQMLALLRLVRDGQIPLLGPPTSIGNFHHGVLFYYLTAPAAFLSDADPVAVASEIALAGSLAVLPVWWLAREFGGALAGAIAGLLLATSAATIHESTQIWNPNLVTLSSGLALACAWRAWSTGRVRWWLGAAAATAVTMHCHVLGTALLPALGAFLVVDARRRTGPDRRRTLLAGLAGLAIVLATYVPLAIHELTNDFSESRGALAFLAAGGSASTLDPLTRLLLVALRAVAWPISGVVTQGPLAPTPAFLATLLVVGLLVWRLRVAQGSQRTALIWLAATLLWSWLVLLVGAAPLTTVVEGLPVEQYHMFLDPLVLVVVGVGLGAIAGRAAGQAAGQATAQARRFGTVIAGVLVFGIVAWNAAHWQPLVARDGGWPAADTAAERILGDLPLDPVIGMVGLPSFKTPDAYLFPLVWKHVQALDLDREAVLDAYPDDLVVVCDEAFRAQIGADCGGPAEDARIAAFGTGYVVVERFEPAPGRILSVYKRADGPT